jgi:hypothetical protein
MLLTVMVVLAPLLVIPFTGCFPVLAMAYSSLIWIDSVIKGPSYAAPRVQASVEKGMDGGLASKAMEAARRQGEIG